MVMTIRAENLGVKYGDHRIWEGVNITIDSPGLVTILGPNGVGKSTFMYTINRILAPSEGTVYLDGEDVQKLDYKTIAKKVAYVPPA